MALPWASVYPDKNGWDDLNLLEASPLVPGPHSSPCFPYLATGRLNVKNEELDAMMKEASGPINFTVFLTMFGEKLKG